MEEKLYKFTLISSFISALIEHKGLDITDNDIQAASNLADKVINSNLK